MASLVEGYFKLGERNIQFNSFDTVTLKDAQAHQEKYSDLTVKISGYSARLAPLPFGATDAATFSRKKLPAATISSQDFSSLPEFYHTRLDTPDVVDKEALGQVLQICLGYLKYVKSL